MKNLVMLAMSLVMAAAVTMTPQKSQASNAIVDVLEVAAIVALVAIDIDEMNKCSDGQLQYCDYYGYNQHHESCEYQEVTSKEVSESCSQFGRYSTYNCVKSTTYSKTYIESCYGGFHNRY